MVLLTVTLLRQQSNQLTARWTKQHVCVRANLTQDRIPFWNTFYGRHRIKITPTLVLLFWVIRTSLGQLWPETLRPSVSGFLVGAVLGGSGVRFTKPKIWEFPIFGGSKWGLPIFKMVPKLQVYFFASWWTGADLAPGHLMVKKNIFFLYIFLLFFDMWKLPSGPLRQPIKS